MTASDRDALRRQLTRHEGTGPTRGGRYLPYWDCCGKGLRACTCLPRFKGRLTACIGRNIEDVGFSEATKDQMLDEDIDACVRELDRRFPWFATLDTVRQRAMVDLAFNLGIGKLLTFKRFLAAMARGDWDRAGDELVDSDYYRQVGRRGPVIERMIRSGLVAA